MKNQDNNPKDEEIIFNRELNIWEALIPVVLLIMMLAYNIYNGGELFGQYSNHFILLTGGVIAAIVGSLNKVGIRAMSIVIWENLKSVITPILILLLVGSLAGTWMISGIVPSMVYYGLQILSPSIFLAASVIICAIISLGTGSSWTTSATVGIALVSIAGAMNIPLGMAAGAIISGAYFGDKMSPLSDTTNLAPVMAGGELFTHIKYMAWTTIPSILVTLVIFIVIGFTMDIVEPTTQDTLISDMLTSKFNITPWVFIVPAIVVGAIVMKIKPLVALTIGALMGGVFAVIFQPEVIKEAEEIFGYVTQRSYSRIFKPMDSDDIFIVDKNEQVKGLLEMSRGTREQLYLSLRFGLIEEFEKRSEPLPLVMDDIFVNFDESRNSQMLDKVLQFSKKRQVIVLTCHKGVFDTYSSMGANAVTIL